MNLKVLTEAVSTLVSRARFANLAGLTFEGQRDLYQALGYQRQLFSQDYRSRYKRNAVAARIVEAKPEDTWRGGFELIEDDDPNVETEFEVAWSELNERLRITTMLKRTDVLAGLGHYAVLLIGAPGVLETPLVSAEADEILYLAPYAQEDAVVTEFDNNKESPRFGLPIFYTIKRTEARTPTAVVGNVVGKKVHFSRVQPVADGLLDDLVYGTPRLERVWNLLDDLEKVTGGGAEAFWKRADQGIQFNLDPTAEPTSDELKAMQDEVDNYVHGLKRIMRTRGMDINTLGSDVAGFKDPASAIIDQISAGTGIPHRILMGSEQAKLASTQDRTNWDERIEARRRDYAEPQVVRPFVDRLIELGALPEPGEGYEVRWSQLRTADDAEKADHATKLATLNQTMGEIVVTPDEIREVLGREPLDETETERDRAASAAAKEGPRPYRQVHNAADRFRRQDAPGRQAGVQRRPTVGAMDGAARRAAAEG